MTVCLLGMQAEPRGGTTASKTAGLIARIQARTIRGKMEAVGPGKIKSQAPCRALDPLHSESDAPLKIFDYTSLLLPPNAPL